MVRARRIDNEWLLLEELQQRNSGLLELSRGADSFTLEVEGFPAFAHLPDGSMLESVRSRHRIRVVFPRYYPAMPAEVYLAAPAFHPNVNPDTGFICLWSRHRVHFTLEQNLAQLQRVLAWALVNDDPAQVMQPGALLWYSEPDNRRQLPLEFVLLTPVNPQVWESGDAPFRRRLS